MKTEVNTQTKRIILAQSAVDNVLYQGTNNDICYISGGKIVFLTGNRAIILVKDLPSYELTPLSVGESITLIQEAIS